MRLQNYWLITLLVAFIGFAKGQNSILSQFSDKLRHSAALAHLRKTFGGPLSVGDLSQLLGQIEASALSRNSNGWDRLGHSLASSLRRQLDTASDVSPAVVSGAVNFAASATAYADGLRLIAEKEKTMNDIEDYLTKLENQVKAAESVGGLYQNICTWLIGIENTITASFNNPSQFKTQVAALPYPPQC